MITSGTLKALYYFSTVFSKLRVFPYEWDTNRDIFKIKPKNQIEKFIHWFLTSSIVINVVTCATAIWYDISHPECASVVNVLINFEYFIYYVFLACIHTNLYRNLEECRDFLNQLISCEAQLLKDFGDPKMIGASKEGKLNEQLILMLLSSNFSATMICASAFLLQSDSRRYAYFFLPDFLKNSYSRLGYFLIELFVTLRNVNQLYFHLIILLLFGSSTLFWLREIKYEFHSF
ncbi:unnamed protein product [Allacma fusca]|uniref:Uncharacterized protein n=1 Tax=Allacma fusca TaxID=39272 RepID=A0A8J2LCV5_9HEXA|nr:unnamed protein product [Allacma fusca]